MTKKFNVFTAYGSDKVKERAGVPFYLDKESDCYIRIARWCGRNVEHTKAQAELTKQIGALPQAEQDEKRLEVFAEHLITGWNNITDADGNDLPFTTENAINLLKQLPDLADEVVGFCLDRNNYPLDRMDEVVKN